MGGNRGYVLPPIRVSKFGVMQELRKMGLKWTLTNKIISRKIVASRLEALYSFENISWNQFTYSYSQRVQSIDLTESYVKMQKFTSKQQQQVHRLLFIQFNSYYFITCYGPASRQDGQVVKNPTIFMFLQFKYLFRNFLSITMKNDLIQKCQDFFLCRPSFLKKDVSDAAE